MNGMNVIELPLSVPYDKGSRAKNKTIRRMFYSEQQGGVAENSCDFREIANVSLTNFGH